MKIYVIVIGREIGFCNSWKEAEKSVKGYPRATHKSFKNIEAAIHYWEQYHPKISDELK